MQTSTLKPTFWARFIQSQDHFSDQDNMQMCPGEYNEVAIRTSDVSAEAFPEMARDKFYQSASAFFADDQSNAMKYAFQALEICSFTLGTNHASVSIIMEHIATICESQGLNFEAEMMRRGSLEITEEVLKRNTRDSYCH